MKTKATRPRKIEGLRARAEGTLRKSAERTSDGSAREGHRTMHELQVHEIELQMQNEELRRTQQELEDACERYTDLYDFAPCAYLTLGVRGEIHEANLAAATLLGMERKNLIKQKFSRFILEESQDDFYLYGRLIFASGTRQTNHLELKSATGAHAVVRIDGIAEERIGQGERRYHVSLTDITESRRAEAMRVELEQELLQISEHRRIAQDLHDDLGQILTASIHLSSALQRRLAEKSLPEADDEARILALLDQALSQTRSLARGLHPVRAEPNGLMAALEELATRTEKLFRRPCRFKCPRPVLIEDNDTATHLYRIAQEAVTNAIRHGKPRRIEISLDQAASRIRVSVNDDGIGLPPELPKNSGMGLRIMRYRTGMIGGSLEIRRRQRAGTEVLCSVLATKPVTRKDPLS
jgi:two-component system sensor kinase FixL